MYQSPSKNYDKAFKGQEVILVYFLSPVDILLIFKSFKVKIEIFKLKLISQKT